MKTFWSIIGVLVIATAAVWVVNGGAFRKSGGSAARAPSADPVPVAEAPSTRPDGAGGDRAAPTQPTTGYPLGEGEAASAPPAAPTAPPAASAGHNAYHGGAGSVPVSKDSPGDPMGELSSLLKEASPAAPAPVVDAPKPEPASGHSDSGSASDGGSQYTLGPPTEVKAEEDGWTRLDGKYLVRGSGTASDPLIVPWELLVSASETYRPRTGIREMPRRVADLKGKHVKVTGYALFPLMSLETTEVLLMRNQWDGCCIGVPPTPYDAVEVKLAKPADRKDSLLTFVTLEGVIDVDPYVNRDFLLGLYTMSGATLVQPAKGSDADKGL